MDLVLVMPVYNEEDCIVEVIESWRKTLSILEIKFLMLIFNDGSSDGTEQALSHFAHDPKIQIINKKNSGHGPTVLMGYQEAVRRAEWIFQCDSDNEMSPEYFPSLWEKREQFDALFGKRENRNQNLPRKLISACSRMSVRFLFGPGVTDVNTPYRLIRSSVLGNILYQIPADTFAPNVLISGALAKYGFRVYEHFVPHKNRKTGQVSIVKWKLWRAAFRSFRQTLRCSKNITLSPE